ncbi:TraX protein [Paenibacillus uliginis N3/975]|uniref:TraX protein n=1 Tax=Paenibacillus uliginis N3/975 TaxID=1313296 RepID=A0A1X7H810_9BACL|nr:TraX family protein [Paenibacillus uliginis]SMF81136.1 TraX protein [Paenibacillus uliginis N3/975]
MQLLAMLTMLIDHVGFVFFSGQEIWRIIGRIAFPLYVYGLVQGYIHTSSRPRYMFRLGMIALLSQIPYQLAINPYGLNVVVSLLAGAVVLHILDRSDSLLLSIGIVAAASIVMEMFPFDYGAYGLLLILIFRYSPAYLLVPWHLMLNMLYLFLNSWELQLWSLLPTILIAYGPLVWKRIESFRVPSWIWRSFYPLHMLLLATIQLWK